MAHIYSIHLVLPFSLKRIPKHASTHYTLTVYPTKDITPKTQKGFAPKPAAQRKTSKKARPLAVAKPVPTPVATPKAKKQRSKFRKNINKPALAAYFDNDVKMSRAAAVQQWQNAVVAELEAADKIAAQKADIARQELRQFVESIHNTQEYNYYMEYLMWLKQTQEYGIYDEYDIDPNDDLYFGNFDDYELNSGINTHAENNEEDDFYLFSDIEPAYPHRKSLSIDTMESERAEINESIVDRFTRKYNGADTNAAMRAFEKQKFHSTGLPYILHQLQITK
ncbi:MAG: hypothetical protein K2M34_05125 [Alphaproteobacteria bacterium]|nr:hypothetical protein [Alphaproteobacteria bacterium]